MPPHAGKNGADTEYQNYRVTENIQHEVKVLNIKKERIRRSTFIWCAALAALFIAALLCALLMRNGDAKIARIYRHGELVREIDLSMVYAPYEFTLEYTEGYNIIRVEPGAISVADADCSDHTCINQGRLTGGMTPIVCLPHGIVIQLEEAAEGPDAVIG